MADTATLFLCGDVMTGRGIDQIRHRAVDPVLHEPWVKNALDYVRAAEQQNGPVPRPVGPAYIWGDALALWEEFAPDIRFVNLETAVTTGDDFWPSKGIHYRMHPANVDCLRAAGIDGCTLANNHVLDFGRAGLGETLAALASAGIAVAGAGESQAGARAPAVFGVGDEARVLVFACCHGSSGVPSAWAASGDESGVRLLPDLGEGTARLLATEIAAKRAPGDIIVVSIHWGGNWGYEVPGSERAFAHALIDTGAADIVHGHSSHHPKGMERRRGKLILYGCGDFLNDYEGIEGHEAFRPWLSLMYFVTVDTITGDIRDVTMVPLRMRRLRLAEADADDVHWLAGRLREVSGEFDTAVRLEHGRLHLAPG